MENLDIYIVDENATLLDAAEKIERNEERAVMVVNDGIMVGMISQGDIMRSLLRGVDVRSPLQPYVRRAFKYLNERDLNAAFELISKHNISAIPVVDNEFRLQDVITLGQLLPNMEYP